MLAIFKAKKTLESENFLPWNWPNDFAIPPWINLWIKCVLLGCKPDFVSLSARNSFI
jgi:hypothetical protein